MSEQTNLPWWLEQAHTDFERQRGNVNRRKLVRDLLDARIQRDQERERQELRRKFEQEREQEQRHELELRQEQWREQRREWERERADVMWTVPPGAYGTFVDSIPDVAAYFIVSVNKARWSFQPPLKVWRVQPRRNKKTTHEETVEALKAIITQGIETCQLLWEAAEFEYCGWCGHLLTRPESKERKFGPDCWANLLALKMMRTDSA